MGEDNKSLLDLVNDSGFLFQLKIEDVIIKTRKNVIDEWKIAAREYRWVDLQTGSEGFIDLILENGMFRLVVECKKVSGGNWIFLYSKDSNKARLAWTYKRQNQKDVAGFGEFLVHPETPESSFCIVRGQSDKDKPMLERISGLLLRSTESLANEEFKFTKITSRLYRVYCPVIVTNATIKLCYFDPELIDLSTGQLNIDDSRFVTVPYVRFRKGLSTSGFSDRPQINFHSASAEQQRSFFIVNSNHLLNFLQQFTIQKLEFEEWPWLILEEPDNPHGYGYHY